jgi:hypothetical protein
MEFLCDQIAPRAMREYNRVHFDRYPPEYRTGIKRGITHMSAEYHPGITRKVNTGNSPVLLVSREVAK